MKTNDFRPAINVIIAAISTYSLGDVYSSMEMSLFASAIFSNLCLLDLMRDKK